MVAHKPIVLKQTFTKYSVEKNVPKPLTTNIIIIKNLYFFMNMTTKHIIIMTDVIRIVQIDLFC